MKTIIITLCLRNKINLWCYYNYCAEFLPLMNYVSSLLVMQKHISSTCQTTYSSIFVPFSLLIIFLRLSQKILSKNLYLKIEILFSWPHVYNLDDINYNSKCITSDTVHLVSPINSTISCEKLVSSAGLL